MNVQAKSKLNSSKFIHINSLLLSKRFELLAAPERIEYKFQAFQLHIFHVTSVALG